MCLFVTSYVVEIRYCDLPGTAQVMTWGPNLTDQHAKRSLDIR
jgi:hypothetical protein